MSLTNVRFQNVSVKNLDINQNVTAPVNKEQKTTEAKKGLDAAQNLIDSKPAEALAVAQQAIRPLAELSAAPAFQDLLAANDPRQAHQKIVNAQTELEALQTKANSEWPSTLVEGEKISALESLPVIPEDTATKWFVVETSNGTQAEAGVTKPVWTTNVTRIRVDHGSYFWDFGVGFAAVHNGTNNKPVDGAQPCQDSSSCGWAFQPLLTGTVYPAGRDRSSPRPRWPGYLGLQAGVNLDVTKISNAVSLGVVIEPVNGLGITGGAMLFARATAPADAKGNQATEHVFLPYVGLSLSSEFYGAIKAVSDGGGQGKKE